VVRKVKKESAVIRIICVIRMPSKNSEIRNQKSNHEKGNDKIHYSDLVGDIKRHRNQPGGDFVHQHAVSGDSP